ncbi:MAG TPA: LysR family transcriptional regulator [Clostridiales bacterium]|nr:LysR family transcriptional regulator [Clostridiales bacterium]
MKFSQIRYFITLAKCLNFTEAARQLYITQPSLSRQISAIEEELGMKLFIRNKKATTLTPAGEHILSGFIKLHEDYDKLVREAGAIDRSYSRSLKIGLLDCHAANIKLVKIIRRLTKENPTIYVELRSFGFKALIDELLSGGIDIAVTTEFEVADNPHLRYKPLAILGNYLVVPADSPGAKKRNPQLADFKHFTFGGLVSQESASFSKLMLQSCREAGFEPRIREFQNYRDFSIAVDTCQVIAGLSSQHHLYNSKHLKFIKVPEIQDILQVVAWNPAHNNPAVSVFLKILPEITIKIED